MSIAAGDIEIWGQGLQDDTKVIDGVTYRTVRGNKHAIRVWLDTTHATQDELSKLRKGVKLHVPGIKVEIIRIGQRYALQATGLLLRVWVSEIRDGDYSRIHLKLITPMITRLSR